MFYIFIQSHNVSNFPVLKKLKPNVITVARISFSFPKLFFFYLTLVRYPIRSARKKQIVLLSP